MLLDAWPLFNSNLPVRKPPLGLISTPCVWLFWAMPQPATSRKFVPSEATFGADSPHQPEGEEALRTIGEPESAPAGVTNWPRT